MSNIVNFQDFVNAHTARIETAVAVGQNIFAYTHENVRNGTASRSVPANKGTVCAAEPLMSYSDIRRVMDAMLGEGRMKEYACFCVGLSTGLRVSDIVALRFGDVFNVEHCCDTFSAVSGFQYERQLRAHRYVRLTFKDSLDIIEQKTKKRTVSNVDEMLITEAMSTGVTAYLKSLNAVQDGDAFICRFEIDEDSYLFPASRNGGCIAESTVYRAITNAVKKTNISCHAGTHTMRKTFLNIANTMGSCSSFNANATALTDCQILARHSSVSTTLRYMNATKHRVVSLRSAVSDFLMGKTKVKSLQAEYNWELE